MGTGSSIGGRHAFNHQLNQMGNNFSVDHLYWQFIVYVFLSLKFSFQCVYFPTYSFLDKDQTCWSNTGNNWNWREINNLLKACRSARLALLRPRISPTWLLLEEYRLETYLWRVAQIEFQSIMGIGPFRFHKIGCFAGRKKTVALSTHQHDFLHQIIRSA